MSNNGQILPSAPASEETPLTVDGNISSSDYGYNGPLRNTACLAAPAFVAVVVLIILIIATTTNPSSPLELRISSAPSVIQNILQWCILISSFLLSVASLRMAGANNQKIQQFSAIISTLQTQQHQRRPGEDSALKATQQQAMLSLAILVCNYSHLFTTANQYIRRFKHLNQYAFLFSALKTSTIQMLDGLNKVYATGITHEIINSNPDASEQFTLYSAHLLDAANHDNKLDKWGKREIIEGNERLLVQIMSYLTNNNECIGGEAAVNPMLNRIDALLDAHLHLLEA